MDGQWQLECSRFSLLGSSTKKEDITSRALWSTAFMIRQCCARERRFPSVTNRARLPVAGHRQLARAKAMAGVSARHSPWPTRAAVIAATATLLAALGGLYFSAQSTLQATEQSRQNQASQTSERFSRSVELMTLT